jgi:hypothetical protein
VPRAHALTRHVTTETVLRCGPEGGYRRRGMEVPRVVFQPSHRTGLSRSSWVVCAIALAMVGPPATASAEAIAEFRVPDDPFLGPSLLAPRLIVAGSDGRRASGRSGQAEMNGSTGIPPVRRSRTERGP